MNDSFGSLLLGTAALKDRAELFRRRRVIRIVAGSGGGLRWWWTSGSCDVILNPDGNKCRDGFVAQGLDGDGLPSQGDGARVVNRSLAPTYSCWVFTTDPVLERKASLVGVLRFRK